MDTVKQLGEYASENGNEISYQGKGTNVPVTVRFRGSGNRLVVASDAKIVELVVDFFGDNGTVVIGPTTKPRTGLRFAIRVGHESSVTIGKDVGSQTRTYIVASEGASVSLGEDCMLASSIEIRTDDSHPIYDVRTERRINNARSISIGDHVWIGKYAAILGGVSIGSGSVVGFRSIVTKSVPNNSIAAGSPARVLRKNIAWERPKLNARKPGQSLVLPGEKSARFWNETECDQDEVAIMLKAPSTSRVRSLWRSLIPKSVRRQLLKLGRTLTPPLRK